MKICIGIISYLPDDSYVRSLRQDKIKQLIGKCNEIFNLPIFIVAQNWKDFSLKGSTNCTFFSYPQRLGIIGARKELRKIFLESDFDYLIMLDDDSELYGTRESGNKYINDIKNHPNMWSPYKPMLLKLFAISKEMFNKVDYMDGSVENGDFFEDMLLIKTLEKKYQSRKFIFSHSDLREKSDSAKDPLSTWFHGQYDKHEIGDRTREIISKL